MSEIVPEYMGCPWPVDPACMTEEWDALEESVQVRALALASSTLNRLTAYRVSNCPVTVRPVSRSGRNACFVPGYDLALLSPGVTVEGHWVNNCGGYAAGCAIILPRPVGRVDEVRLHGAVLDASDYLVRGNQVLWAGDGDCPWINDQDVTLPDTEPGTMSVTYLNAYPVDSLGAYAAGVLALEFAKACTDSRNCALPKGVTAIVRAGVAMEINPGMFADGFTGIREVDSFIALWNPRGAKQRMATKVWSPDLHPVDVTGGTAHPSAQFLDGGSADG